MRTAIIATVITAFGLATTDPKIGPKFFPDDPHWVEPDTQDASKVSEQTLDLEYDILENLFRTPGDPTPNVRARNLNTVDEVPDSSWYTNRAGRQQLTLEDMAWGPNRTRGPAPGPWTVISGKTDGVTPGFVMSDVEGVVWYVKFDSLGHNGMATGAEIISTKLLWALGYNVPENHITFVAPQQLVVGTAATIRTPAGKRPLRPTDLTTLLRNAAREDDGSYRALASRRIDGKPVGPFRFYGVRSDDPNDYVPHEHRRELRAYGTFAAWLNHVDSKAVNTFDTLVTEGDRAAVRHYLLDFGSTLGSGNLLAREAFEGSQALLNGCETVKTLLSFGFRIQPWRRLPMIQGRAIGALPIDQENWDPDQWMPRVPNPAFVRARADDKFWAARKVEALTPDLLRAAIETAQYGDPAADAAILRFLSDRRLAILRRYYTTVNPVVDPSLGEDNVLRFRNAAVDADVAPPPAAYRTVWSRFDNQTLRTTPIAERTSDATAVRAPIVTSAMGIFIKVEIAAVEHVQPSWTVPVHAYFRRDPGRWTLVGFERVPES